MKKCIDCGKKISQWGTRCKACSKRGSNNPNWGKAPSAETRRKIGRAKQGMKFSPGHRRKLSEARGARRGENSPFWGKKHSPEARQKMSEARGGKKHRVHDTGGYIRIYNPNHPRADCNGRVLEHRLIMEKKLKRLLEPAECVHHKNDIRDDNCIDNLAVFVSKRDHLDFHIKRDLQSVK